MNRFKKILSASVLALALFSIPTTANAGGWICDHVDDCISNSGIYCSTGPVVVTPK
jgi:hypothetical protein